MRIGIYLGRYSASRGGIWVYARELALRLAEHAADGSHEKLDFIFYGDKRVLSRELQKHLLSQGIKTRVLPDVLGRRAGFLLDQVLIPIFARLDKVELLHALANTALLFTSLEQIVTVHDLYQGWPPERERDWRRSIWRKAVSQLYRGTFHRQFKKVKRVITDSEAVKQEIITRFHYEGSRINVIPLGIAHSFVEALNQIVSLQAEKKDSQHGPLSAGYLLVLASRDRRKNLERTLLAWKQLPEELRECGLVVVLSDEGARTRVEQALANEISLGRVRLLGRQNEFELASLLVNAAGLLFPTLAEGFGLPALEARAAGSAVICAELECLELIDRQGVHVCDPLSVASIAEAAAKCLRELRPGVCACRTMREAVDDTFAVYKNSDGSKFSDFVSSLNQ